LAEEDPQLEDVSRSVSFTFRDADEASTFLSTSYAPVKLEPLARSSFDLTVSATLLNGIQIYRSDTNNGVHFSSTGYFDGFTFSSMILGATRVTAGHHDHEIARGRGLAIDAETVTQLSISQQSDFNSVAISTEDIQAHLRDRISDDATARIRFDKGGPGESFFSHCRLICDVIHTGCRPGGALTASPIALSRLEERLVDLVLYGVAHNYSHHLELDMDLPTTIVLKAADYMHAHAHLPITTAHIAKALGVGLRSLQLSFQRSLETTPHQYLRLVRLRRARRDLMSGTGLPISGVARKWGFPWSGEFARLYLQTFGEKPFDTVRRYRVSI